MNDSDNKPQMLTLREIAKRWAGETHSVDAETLVENLALEVLNGAFESTDYVDTYDLLDNRLSLFDLSFKWFAKQSSSNLTRQEIMNVADSVKISLEGIARFCDQPNFDDWSVLHGVGSPKFVAKLLHINHRDKPANNVSESPNSYPVAKRYSAAAVAKAYWERAQNWPIGLKTPSRDDDDKWVKKEFGQSVGREFTRDLRRKHAPSSWKKPGGHKKAKKS